VSLYVPTAPYISLYLPIPPYTSLYLPIVPTSPYISLHLRISNPNTGVATPNPDDDFSGSGDVKYHLGMSYTRQTVSGKRDLARYSL